MAQPDKRPGKANMHTDYRTGSCVGGWNENTDTGYIVHIPKIVRNSFAKKKIPKNFLNTMQ